MDRIAILLNEIANYKREKRNNAAYFKALEAYFEAVKVIIAAYFFRSPRFLKLSVESGARFSSRKDSAAIMPPYPIDPETFRKMGSIADAALKEAEKLVWAVVEIDAKLATALEAEVLLITGEKAQIQPKMLNPSKMFLNELAGTANNDSLSGDAFKSNNPYSSELMPKIAFAEKDKLFPQIPLSKLALDFLGTTYNGAMLLERSERLRSEPAKNKSNALYLTEIRTILNDLNGLSRQREGLDHVLYQSQQELRLLNIAPQVLAEQMSLLDCLNFQRVKVWDELEFSNWLGKERRLRAPNLTAMREVAGFVSRWVTWEVLREGILTWEGRSEVLIHWLGVAECLRELSSYHMMMAVIRGLSCQPILQLAPLMQVTPDRAKSKWDELQRLLVDAKTHRALVSKAAATCIPALDTAYLSELMYIEPKYLSKSTATANDGKGAENRPVVAEQKRFLKYADAIEKFRIQSQRVYAKKFALHPAVENFILTRPFVSLNELQAISDGLAQGNLLKPHEIRILPFYRQDLDDDERLFMPLSDSSRPFTSAAAPLKSKTSAFSENDLSLGGPNDTLESDFALMDDAVERVSRDQGLGAITEESFKIPLDEV